MDRAPAIWITRAEPGASATAKRVRALGLEPVVEPLLEARALPGPRLDLADVAALAFTSANAVRAFAARSDARRLPVFSVGAATAAAARAEGFADVVSAEGDVQALASAIADRRAGADGLVLYGAPAAPSGDLAGLLRAAGVKVRQATLYETVGREPSGALIARISELEGVLVHSARAAGALAAFLERRPAGRLTAWCLSEQAASPLRGVALAGLVSAAQPNESALLALLPS